VTTRRDHCRCCTRTRAYTNKEHDGSCRCTTSLSWCTDPLCLRH